MPQTSADIPSAGRSSSRRWLGLLALIATAALWSLNGPLIKLLARVDGGVPGVAISCYRSLIGGLVFLPFALRRLDTLRSVAPAWAVGSVLCFTVMTASFVIATTLTAAANAIILQYTSPIWVFLLAPPLLGERPRWQEGAVLLGAMAGVAIIFLGQRSGDLAALLVALASGLGYGSLTVTLRGLRRVSPVLVAALNALGSGAILALAVALWSSFDLTPRQLGLILLLSLVQFTLPYVMFSWALQYVEAHRAALIVLLEAVLNPLFTFALVGEAPPNATLIGGPLILLSVAGYLLLAWRQQRGQTPVTSAPSAAGPPPARRPARRPGG